MVHSSWSWTLDKSIPSGLPHGREVVDEVIDQLRTHDWNDSDVFAVRMALEEAVVNAIKHGNRSDPVKAVHIDCRLNHSKIRILVRDEGPGFDPEEVPDCTADENLDKPSGRGLLLIRHYMTSVEYNACGNVLVMEKEVDQSDSN